jgi:hypothetical protein
VTDSVAATATFDVASVGESEPASDRPWIALFGSPTRSR